MSLANVTLNLTHVILSIHHVILSEVEGSKGRGNGGYYRTDGRFFAPLRTTDRRSSVSLALRRPREVMKMGPRLTARPDAGLNPTNTKWRSGSIRIQNSSTET